MSELLDSWNQKIIEFFAKRVSQSKSEEKEVDFINKISEKKIEAGKRIIKATHVLKFTHSSAPNAGVLIDDIGAENVLTTAVLGASREYDMAHHNGNLIGASKFLALSLKGKSIFDCIMDDDFAFLDSFCDSQDQLSRWKEGLVSLIEVRNINTAEFAKQIYFPITDGDNIYHIIIPLFSSSISNAIHGRVKPNNDQVRKREKTKDVDAKTKYAQGERIKFPNRAVTAFGGSHPQNISMLNEKETYLFNGAPPTWQSQPKAPVRNKSFFDEYVIFSRTQKDIDYLSDFLLRFERSKLSIKSPGRKEWIKIWIDNIVDVVFYYVSIIHQLHPGWSCEVNVKLKIEHQYLLDPYRKDQAFQTNRKLVDWQSVICRDFAAWLNHSLVGKEKEFTPQEEHTRLWQKLFADHLREFNSTIELASKKIMEVNA